MPFVSYAQNREDAVLWRVFADFGPGYYIDVGAGDPIVDSVTKAFSIAGWRGINIDPMPQPMELLRQDRPRDINLQLALEAEPGLKTYFSVKGGNGLSTGVAEYATRYRNLGWEVVEIEVEIDTLANVCTRFVSDEIHFLKIDAEGREEAILRGADFERYRPWIVVVEALAPCVLTSSEGAPVRRQDQEIAATFESWEGLLTSAGYQFVLFDGLNRFYVANEKADLFAERLRAPANILDDIVSASDLDERDAERREILRIAAEDVQRALAEVNALRARSVELADMFGEELSSLRARNVELADSFAEELSSLRAQYDEITDELKSTNAAMVLSHAELDGAYQQLYELSRHVSSLAARVHRRESELMQVELRASALEEHGAAVSRELNAVLASKAWRLTKPLRKVRGLFRRRPNAG